MVDTSDLPDVVAVLKAMLIAATAREADKVAQIARKGERIERLEKLVAAFKQAAFGRKSEKTDPTSLIWHWKTWKRPWLRSMPRMKRALLLGRGSPGHARPIAAHFLSIFPEWMTSSSQKACSAPAVVARIASVRMSPSGWT
jgi:hypothetical protein